VGFDSQQENIFVFTTVFKPPVVSIQPPFQWVLRALSPGLKQLEHKADYTTPSA
jgi:hypothetical protein